MVRIVYIIRMKSLAMINLLSKSPETYEKLNLKLDTILTEQRHQRADLSTIKRQLHTIIIDSGVQKQVDKYFEEEPDAASDNRD